MSLVPGRKVIKKYQQVYKAYAIKEMKVTG